MRLTEGHDRIADYIDMGGGKTFIGSEQCVRFGDKIILVVCQKSKVQDWIDHFTEHYGDMYKVFDATSKKKADVRSMEYGFWMNYKNGSVTPSVIVINYDLIWRRKEYEDLSGFTLMLDESSMIQDETAKRTKFIMRLNPAHIILLSGTPTAGKYEKLWSQLHLLGWGISKDLYYKQYVITEYIDVDGSGFMIPIIKGYRNVDRLKEKLKTHGAVFMKTEEFGLDSLPRQNDITVSVPASKDYRTFMKKRIVTVGGHWTDYVDENGSVQNAFTGGHELVGDTTLTKRLYARQLCGHYNKDKLDAFRELIQSSEDRFVVFYNFTAEMNAMRDIVENLKRPVSIVNGSTKDLNNFWLKPDSVTFIQYQAGAMGLNLQLANKVIYFTLPERSELFEQSKKRIHRIGQNRPCFYYYLICPGTVEEDIRETLKMRKDYTDELFRQKYD